MTAQDSALAASLADRYRIERELGAGGMATVYLAYDLKHGRDVAIKVLHPDVAAAFGVQRFLTEIRTTARLQHAHIVPLLDSGEAGDGILYYVMPVVAGESLRARLDRETQLPVADALRIADQVAAALDYAHRQGIVHRDVKPENILLHDGQALVADFGIALATDAAADARLTGTGVGLGTPHYMSPEQAAGDRTVSARSDIYALGAVVYEMLAGEPPFTGPTQQAVIAKALTQSPTPLRVLRHTVPPAMDAAILRALEKVPADRFTTAADFARALRDERLTPAGGDRRMRWVAVLLGAAAVVAVIAWGLSRSRAPALGAGATTRAMVPIARGFTLPTGSQLYPMNLSSDGRMLAYVAERGGVRRLFVRRLAEFTESELPGTEGATHPAFSSDGEWIAYFARDQLLKIPVSGGTPILVAPARGAVGGASWSGDSLLFSADGRLYLTITSGGATSEIAVDDALDAGPSALPRRRLRWPQLLPGGSEALLSVGDSVAILDITSRTVRSLLAGNQGSYLPTGHIVFAAPEGRIRVAPFDLVRHTVTGAAIPVFEAFRGPASGANYFAVSSSGTLVYVPGGFDRALALVDRNGRETPVPAAHRGYRFPRISPDGRRAVVTIDPRPSKTWIVDLESGALSPVATPGRSDDEHRIHPVWSPDGRRVAYTRGPGGILDVANVEGEPGVVAAFRDLTGSSLSATEWLADDRLVAHTYGTPRLDVVTFRLGDSAAVPLIATPAFETQGRVSPDGRWLAYSSDVSGAREVYVRPFSGAGSAVAVSTTGGVEPRWAHDGRTLYYRNGQDIMAVAVRPGPLFAASRVAERLFTGGYDFQQDDNWDVGPDGRFLMVKADPNAGTQFLVVLNWFDELRARLPR